MLTRRGEWMDGGSKDSRMEVDSMESSLGMAEGDRLLGGMQEGCRNWDGDMEAGRERMDCMRDNMGLECCFDGNCCGWTFLIRWVLFNFY